MNAKKQARRERAAKRFSILTRDDYARSNINLSSDGKFDRWDKRIGNLTAEAQTAEYGRYVERKQQEAAALGI